MKFFREGLDLSAAATIPPKLRESSAILEPKAWLGAVAVVTVFLVFITAPGFYPDATNYPLHTVQHSRGQIAPRADPLWDFEHVLWRPLGCVIWVALNGPHSSSKPPDSA